jgi:hypothetical protein
MKLKSGKFYLAVNVVGETPQEAWDNLLTVVVSACEHKQNHGGVSPKAVWQDEGSIEVKPLPEGTFDWNALAELRNASGAY